MTMKMVDNILEVIRKKFNNERIKSNYDSPTYVRNELIRDTMSVLFTKIEEITLQIEKTSDMLTDIEKLKIDLSWVLAEIDDIEKALDTLIGYTDVSKIDELAALSNSKLVEDYCNFLHFLRHDIIGHLALIRSFFIDIELFTNKTDLLMREIKRTQIIKKRISILTSATENNFEDFDLYSLMRYTKNARLN